MPVFRAVQDLTDRIAARSTDTRRDYLSRIDASRANGLYRAALSCGNLAHGFAACSPIGKERVADSQSLNLGIVGLTTTCSAPIGPTSSIPTSLGTRRVRLAIRRRSRAAYRPCAMT